MRPSTVLAGPGQGPPGDQIDASDWIGANCCRRSQSLTSCFIGIAHNPHQHALKIRLEPQCSLMLHQSMPVCRQELAGRSRDQKTGNRSRKHCSEIEPEVGPCKRNVAEGVMYTVLLQGHWLFMLSPMLKSVVWIICNSRQKA